MEYAPLELDGVKRVVRPTLRCLVGDLAQQVEPEDLRVALRTVLDDIEADPNHLLPCALYDARHPVLDKANFLASDEAALRERIEVITDAHVIKVKTGDRRGALWEDADGTWWLIAAGRRQDDGRGDFYTLLERYARDSSALAPTDDDRRYHLLEEAYAAECESERRAQGELLGAVLRAALHAGTCVQCEVFGATVSITVTPDDELHVLEVSWQFVDFEEQDRFPMDILAMVPGRESIDSWEFLPARSGDDSPHCWFTYVPDEWVEHMATSSELDELLDDSGDWTPVNPSSDGSEHFSHLARGSVVTLAYVTGIEIVGLCGARVVAHRDYERFPVCPTCSENLQLLREHGKDDRNK